MQLRNTLKFFLTLLVGTIACYADGVTPDALSKNGAVTRDRHLMEISDVLLAGRGGYIDFGLYYTPFASQHPLKSQYGEHDGFAFRHHLGAFAAGEVAPQKYMGALLWFDRSGWDGEDFFLFPQYNDFSIQRSVTTWGLTYADQKNHFGIAAGMQHQNMEHTGIVYERENDSLAYSWAYLRIGKASVSGNFYKTDWRSVHLSLDLEHRSIFEDKIIKYEGWMDYLPNIDVGYYNGGKEDNRLRVIWNQNLYDQHFYGEVAYDFLPDVEFHSAALKYYPDPSRLFGLEATCVRRGIRSGAKDLLWGGAIDLVFARIAYNSSYDYDQFFGSKGTFLVEFKISLDYLDGKVFGRGAPQAMPMETTILKEKNKPKDKSLEATGIRFENGGNK